jgi:hypothetical protein
METGMISRRTFVNGLAAGVAGSALASTAKSYAQIIGANDRLNFAINGLNGRGHAHLSALKANLSKIARVAYICDVDANIRAKFAADAQQALGYAPKAEADFRHALASSEVSTPSASPLPITGTPRSPFSASRPASMSTSKSLRARTPAKANCWWPRRRSTASWSRSATSSAPRLTPSR